jgi:hypothetical protein
MIGNTFTTPTRNVMASMMAAVILLGSSFAWAEPVTTAPGVAKFSFLRGSKWYVPRQTLPAIEMKLQTGATRAIVDQTVWNITNYRDGYFWGRTAAVFTYPAGGQPASGPSCSRMVGSVTPSGNIHITFIPDGQKTLLGSVVGTGTLTGNKSDGWTFEMQMSTGTTSVIAHWSYMDQCKPGDACETKLPGSKLSLADFLKQCDAP